MLEKMIKTALTALKKISQICDYQSFDKKSLKNQEEKLKQMFKTWLLLVGSPSSLYGYHTSFIGKDKAFLMNATIIELEQFWTNENIQNYFCHLIKSINFKTNDKITPAFNDMKQFIITVNQDNLLKKQPFDDIILDTVKNNRTKICQYLHNEFKSWL